MTNKQLLNLIGILALAAVYALAIYFLIPDDVLGYTGKLNVHDQAAYIQSFRDYMSVVAGVAVLCSLTWFVLGGWGIKPWAPARTWYLSWFSLLLLILLTATVLCFVRLDGAAPGPVSPQVASFYFLGGVAYFYLASVFFSPTHAMYLIWPSRLIRRW